MEGEGEEGEEEEEEEGAHALVYALPARGQLDDSEI